MLLLKRVEGGGAAGRSLDSGRDIPLAVRAGADVLGGVRFAGVGCGDEILVRRHVSHVCDSVLTGH